MTGEPLENPDIVVRRNRSGMWWFEPISRPAEDFLAAHLGDDRPSLEINGERERYGQKSFLVPDVKRSGTWRAAEAKGLVVRHVP